MLYDYFQFFYGCFFWVKLVVIGVVVIFVLLAFYFLVRVVGKLLGLSLKNELFICFDVEDINFQLGDGLVINFDVEFWVFELYDVFIVIYLFGFGISKCCDIYCCISVLNLNQFWIFNFVYEVVYGRIIWEVMCKIWDFGCMVFGSVGIDYGDLLEIQFE